jgi:hypothetical protein
MWNQGNWQVFSTDSSPLRPPRDAPARGRVLNLVWILRYGQVLVCYVLCGVQITAANAENRTLGCGLLRATGFSYPKGDPMDE